MDIKELEFLFNNVKAATLPLAPILLDVETQQRVKKDGEAIIGYIEQMKANGVANWEPILVVELTTPHNLPDGSILDIGSHILVDGFHRVDAAIAANYDVFPTKVTQATYETAVYYSLIANKKNGVSLTGKDFQKAIKRLYSMNPDWRAYGKKVELSLLFGCSSKTVERAVKVIDGEIKEQSFNMFSQGQSDSEVIKFAYKSINTIKAWREEYEQSLLDDEKEANSDSEGEKAVDYLNMTIKEALGLTDVTAQQGILIILQEAFGIEEKSSESPESPKEPISDIDILADEWESLGNCYDIIGVTKEKLNSYVNKKAQLNRAYNKLLRQCHPDQHGDNKAVNVLMNAVSQIKKELNIK